jgi:competence protein ComEA
MTPRHTLRFQDQAIQIGPRHGYRIDGDHAFINADLQVPPYHTGGNWALELWATEHPYQEGPLTGAKVAQLALDLPTPIGPYVHQVDMRTPARLPLQGRAYSMVLALTHPGPEGQTGVHAFANYPEPETFSAPYLEGKVAYAVQGQEVLLEADGIVNPRLTSNLSGTLSLELWAFPESGALPEGLRLAACQIEPIVGQSQLTAVERRVAFSEPPVGRFQIAMLLCEWTLAHGYIARDQRAFGYVYERLPPEVAGSSQARSSTTPVAAVTGPARAVDRLRLVPTPEPEVAAAEHPPSTRPEADVAASAAPTRPELAITSPTATAAPAVAEVPTSEPRDLVSIQTSSLEELARVKGLNPKLASEIIMARPFTSLADLIRVRGIGPKTIDRLKGLVRL